MANHRIIDRDSAHLDPVQHYHVARFIRGGTNQSVILPRRGPETFQPRVMYWVACACLGLFVVCDNPPASSKPASSQCLRGDEIEIFEVLASNNPLRRAKPELQAA